MSVDRLVRTRVCCGCAMVMLQRFVIFSCLGCHCGPPAHCAASGLLSLSTQLRVFCFAARLSTGAALRQRVGGCSTRCNAPGFCWGSVDCGYTLLGLQHAGGCKL